LRYRVTRKQVNGVAIFVAICCRLTPIHQRSVSAYGSSVFITERRHWWTLALRRAVIGRLTLIKAIRDSARRANNGIDDDTKISSNKSKRLCDYGGGVESKSKSPFGKCEKIGENAKRRIIAINHIVKNVTLIKIILFTSLKIR